MDVEAWHLTKRFFGSLSANQPSADEENSLVALLSPAEESLYRAQCGADRCHSVRNALVVREALGSAAGRHVVVAAALHDVGKAEADLGTAGRVVATIVARVAGRATMRAWSSGDGRRGRIGRYALHDALGAELLMAAGAHPMVVAWAGEHHGRAEGSTIDPDIVAVLLRADG